jgi:predicted PurR-regulated permease PerM
MIRLEVSTRGVLVIAGVFAGLWLVVQLWPVLLLVVVSLMFASALLPFVDWLIRYGFSRGLAVLAVVVLVFVAVALIGLIVAPVVVEQGRAIVDRLPDLRDETVRFLNRHGASDLARQVEQFRPADFVGPGLLAESGRRALGVITSIVTIIALTAYIMFDARRIQRFMFFATPARYHDHIRNLEAALQRVVGGYLRGQFLTSAVITVFTFVVLEALRVPNALALAVLAGIADMIPVIGVVLAVGPATLAALSVGLPRAIIVAALLLAYQQFENQILVQRIYGATLRLPAVVVFVALLVGAELLGVAGALLSLPAAAALRVVIEYGNDVRTGRIAAVAPPDEPFAPDVQGAGAEPAVMRDGVPRGTARVEPVAQPVGRDAE